MRLQAAREVLGVSEQHFDIDHVDCLYLRASVAKGCRDEVVCRHTRVAQSFTLKLQ